MCRADLDTMSSHGPQDKHSFKQELEEDYAPSPELRRMRELEFTKHNLEHRRDDDATLGRLQNELADLRDEERYISENLEDAGDLQKLRDIKEASRVLAEQFIRATLQLRVHIFP